MHWIYIVLIVVVSLAALGVSIWLFLLHYRDRNVGGKQRPECTDEQLQSMMLSKEYLDHLHQLISSTSKALESAGMVNWIDFGTLLSCVRHNGKLIPWDDDADIAVIDSDWRNPEKQALFFKAIANENLAMTKFGSIWQLRLANVSDSPHLDIFLYKISNETVIMANDFAHFMNRANVFAVEEIFPLQTKIIYNSAGTQLRVNVPNKAKDVLGRVYGSKENPESWQNELIAVQHKQIATLLKPCRLTTGQKERLFA